MRLFPAQALSDAPEQVIRYSHLHQRGLRHTPPDCHYRLSLQGPPGPVCHYSGPLQAAGVMTDPAGRVDLLLLSHVRAVMARSSAVPAMHYSVRDG